MTLYFFTSKGAPRGRDIALFTTALYFCPYCRAEDAVETKRAATDEVSPSRIGTGRRLGIIMPTFLCSALASPHYKHGTSALAGLPDPWYRSRGAVLELKLSNISSGFKPLSKVKRSIGQSTQLPFWGHGPELQGTLRGAVRGGGALLAWNPIGRAVELRVRVWLRPGNSQETVNKCQQSNAVKIKSHDPRHQPNNHENRSDAMESNGTCSSMFIYKLSPR